MSFSSALTFRRSRHGDEMLTIAVAPRRQTASYSYLNSKFLGNETSLSVSMTTGLQANMADGTVMNGSVALFVCLSVFNPPQNIWTAWDESSHSHFSWWSPCRMSPTDCWSSDYQQQQQQHRAYTYSIKYYLLDGLTQTLQSLSHISLGLNLITLVIWFFFKCHHEVDTRGFEWNVLTIIWRFDIAFNTNIHVSLFL